MDFIITGASAGIGKATALHCISESHRVISMARRVCPVKGVYSLCVDFADENSLLAGMTALPLDLGKDPLCLVHCAAFMQSDRADDLNAEHLRHVFEVNLISVATLNRHLITKMPAGSSIIYIGSTLSEKAVKNTASYVISKHALVGMMRATCQDLDGRGIHTVCICPGFTDTEMLRQHLGEDPANMAAITENITARRLIRPEEIAETIYFAAHHPVLNGGVIHANLGQVER